MEITEYDSGLHGISESRVQYAIELIMSASSEQLERALNDFAAELGAT